MGVFSKSLVAAALLCSAPVALAQSSASASSSAMAGTHADGSAYSDTKAEAMATGNASAMAGASASATGYGGATAVSSAKAEAYGHGIPWTASKYGLKPYTVDYHPVYYPKYVEECPIAVEYKGCKKCEKGCGDDTLWGWDWAEPVVYKDPKCEVIEYECEKVCKKDKVCDEVCKDTYDHVCTPHCEKKPYQHCEIEHHTVCPKPVHSCHVPTTCSHHGRKLQSTVSTGTEAYTTTSSAESDASASGLNAAASSMAEAGVGYASASATASAGGGYVAPPPVCEPVCTLEHPACYTVPEKVCHTLYKEECTKDCKKVKVEKCSPVCAMKETETCELLCAEKKEEPLHCYCTL